MISLSFGRPVGDFLKALLNYGGNGGIGEHNEICKLHSFIFSQCLVMDKLLFG